MRRTSRNHKRAEHTGSTETGRWAALSKGRQAFWAVMIFLGVSGLASLLNSVINQ